jgi:hypothetical protein
VYHGEQGKVPRTHKPALANFTTENPSSDDDKEVAEEVKEVEKDNNQ